MEADVSKKVVLILLVLVVVVSAMGTWAFFSLFEPKSANAAYAGGDVRLAIVPEQQGTSSQGDVQLTVLPREST